MSYDLALYADLGGPEPVSLRLNWNYTSNGAEMWCAAGANLAEFAGKTAGECLPALTAAVATMRAEPERFRAMDPPNGWGSYDTLLPALDELVAAFTEAPMARVWVSK
jgi:hypothetical protein